MKTIIKYSKAIILGAIILFFFTGCGKYSRQDIKSYLNDWPSFADKSNSYQLSKSYIEVIGEDGCTDYVWEVIANINDQSMTFYVIDDYYSPTDIRWNPHNLNDTYYNHVAEYALNNIDLLSFKLEKKELDRYPEEDNPSIDKDILQELNSGRYTLTSSYNDYYEYVERFDEITDIYTKLSNTVWKNVTLYFSIPYTNEYRNNVSGYELTEADVDGWVSSFNDIEELKQEFKERFIIMNLDYRFYDISNLFSSEEITEAVSKHAYRIGILDETNSNCVLVDDLIQNYYGYDISFGTMYELLKKYEKNVVGNPLHYTYYKENGDVYEFSYSFNDSLYDNNKYGYYYKFNNKIVNMDAYFYNHFTCNEVREITGIPVVNVYYTEAKGFYTSSENYTVIQQ